MNIFEQASRRGLRFTTGQGAVTTEDLWDMPLTHARRGYSLDDLAKDLRRQLKDNEEVSFVTPVTRSDEVLQLKFDIVKHIIDVRLAENAAAATERATAERKQKLLEVLARKQDANLEASSEEEIRAMIDAL